MKISKKIIILLYIIFSVCYINNVFADSTHVSFQTLNKNKKYTSFSFGMELSYGTNQSLKNFIQYELPYYSELTRDEQLSDFATGLAFFGGVERQISNNFSIKGEYSYFLKSYNVKLFPNYDFSYTSHQPYLIFYYIIPQEYSYIKLGAGTGYLLSDLKVKEFGSQRDFTSNGLGLKGEIIFNAQIGKSFAGYLSGNISKTFLSNLKDTYGKELLTNGTNETVNLSSFSVGLRLGVEIFFF